MERGWIFGPFHLDIEEVMSRRIDMEEKSNQLFEDMKLMLKKLKKASYESNMKKFQNDHGEFINAVVESVKNSDNTEKAIKEVSNSFVEDVFNAFAVNGKVGGRKQADLNFFMIYYVFPAILLTEEECATELCDGIKEAWNEKFPNTHIGYTTYEKLYESFRTKILGLF